MWGKLQLCSLIAGFVLYFVDLASDIYVAFQHLNNGFYITLYIILISIFIVNMFASTVFKSRLAKACGCIFHMAMCALFVCEIRRWKKENVGEKAYPCNSGKHFSECECNTCKEILKNSVKTSLKMAHVRSVETCCEAVPQWIVQVFFMISKKSYPWYAIISAVISFLSLVWSIYSLEKNYWIKKIAHSHQNYIKPVSFPFSCSIIFIIWQSLLLLGRLCAIVFASREEYMFLSIVGPWFLALVVLTYYLDWDLYWRLKMWCLGLLSGFILYPFFFHVSDSSAACIKTFMPTAKRTPKKFKKHIIWLIPCSFFVFDCGFRGSFYYKNKELLPWYIAIASVYAVSFIFQLIYYKIFHPLKVVKKQWGNSQSAAAVERGTINISNTAE